MIGTKPAHTVAAYLSTQLEGFRIQTDLIRKGGMISSDHAP